MACREEEGLEKADAMEEDPAAHAWQQVTSEEHGSYFWNRETGETQWEDPRQLKQEGTARGKQAKKLATTAANAACALFAGPMTPKRS